MPDQAKTAQPGVSTKGKSKPRSPSYPSLTLEAAIERAKSIQVHEGRNEAAESVIFGHWGYKSKSGPAIGTLAATKAFGLLVVGRGTDTYKVSDLAIRIILDEREDETERREAIVQAALNPPMHRVLWEKYNVTLPSDQSVIYFLRFEKQFTESGAKQLVGLYKTTLSFAGLVGNGKLTPPGRDESQAEERQAMESQTIEGSHVPSGAKFFPPSISRSAFVPASVIKEIHIPISGTAWPSIKAAFPLSEEAWNQMLDVLKVMKPGLVAVPPKDEPAGE